MLMQVSAIPFVRIDVQVNYFRADLQAAFQLQSISDLLRAEICAGQSINFGPLIR